MAPRLGVAVSDVRRRATLLAGLCALFFGVAALAHGAPQLADWQRDLRDPATHVRVRATRALAAFDRPAVPTLVSALGDKEYAVRLTALEALVKMGLVHVVPAMIEALGHGDARVRANAATVLGSFGPAAKPAMATLGRALRDSNPRVSELAGDALDRIIAPSHAQGSLLKCH